MNKFLTLILAGALCLSLGSCKKNEPSASSSGSGDEGTSVYRIATLLPKEDEYSAQITAGAKAAVADAAAAVTFDNKYVGDGDETELLSQLSTSYDALLAYPTEGEAALAELSRIHGKGLPVAIVGTTVVKNDFAVSVSGSDQYKLGEAAGIQAKKYIETKLKNKASIAVLEHNAKNLTESTLRINGFLDQIKEMKAVSLVSDMEASTSEEIAEQLATYFKDAGDKAADIIYCTNADAVIAAHNAIIKAGRKGKTAVFGIDAHSGVTDIIKSSDNTIEAVIVQDYWKMGYNSVMALLDAVKNGSQTVGYIEVTEPITLSAADSGALEQYIKKISEK